VYFLTSQVAWHARPVVPREHVHHPVDCLADINPHDIRLNLDHLVQAIHTAGPDEFHTIASKIKKLPRHMLMAWLKETHGRPGS
jgi:predicted metal-dependent phosphoesterase TrpH